MSFEQKLKPHPNVVFTDLDATQAALLHLDTKRYYSLNETGARIWSYLDQGDDPATIATKLRSEYQIGQEQALACVVEFVDELREEGLAQ